MAYSSENPNWTPITNTEAYQLTACTSTPGIYYPYETTALPEQLQKLPGLYEAYASGYDCTYKDENGVDVLGEFIAAREAGTGKGYVFFIGLSGAQPHFAGPCKPYDGHHYTKSEGVPVEKLFGQSPKPVEQ